MALAICTFAAELYHQNQSQWEDPEIPARENRHGRRLYTLTAAGEQAVHDARKAEAATLRVRGGQLRPA